MGRAMGETEREREREISRRQAGLPPKTLSTAAPSRPCRPRSSSEFDVRQRLSCSTEEPKALNKAPPDFTTLDATHSKVAGSCSILHSIRPYVTQH